MATKQELMSMMEHRLPGEAMPIRNPYSDLSKATYASQQHMEQQNEPGTGQIFSIQQPNAIAVAPNRFGARSHLAYCPSCHVTQMTRCEYESSIMTHFLAVILLLTTCSCCLPYLFDNCKSARHYCQNCGSYLGAYIK